MVQRKYIKRRQQQPIRRFFYPESISINYFGIVICSAVLLFIWTSACLAGGTGPGIGIKIGAQTLDSPANFEETTRFRFEVELASPRFCSDYLDLALTFGGSSLGSSHDQYAQFDDGVLIEEFYWDDYSILDLRLAGRLYPFGDSEWLKPYVGAGIGYFWFLDSWEYEYYETYEDPYVPGVFYTYSESGEERDTPAHDFFPFVTAGLMVPVASNFELQFEFQYPYDKKDSGFDFGGPVYMFGCLFRF